MYVGFMDFPPRIKEIQTYRILLTILDKLCAENTIPRETHITVTLYLMMKCFLKWSWSNKVKPDNYIAHTNDPIII